MSQAISDILIVDDDAPIRDMVADVLTDGDNIYAVRTACNGAIALEMIRERAPDLVLLDVNMPVMNGEELFVELQREGFNELPVLFMTASLTEAKLLKRLSEQTNVDAVAFLAKPFDIDIFSKRVAHYFVPRRENLAM